MNQNSETGTKVKKKRPLLDFLVVSKNNIVYKAIRFSNIFLYLVASFLYAFNAAFKISEKYFDKEEVDPDLNIELLNSLELIIEVWFVVYIILNFFVEYVDEQNQVVRDIAKISQRYLKSKFAFHLLTVIPFTFFFDFKYTHLLYLIKVLRIIDTRELLDSNNFMSVVKASYNSKLQKIIEDPRLANDIDLDQNKIVTIIIIGYAFKTFKLVMTIF